MFVLFYSNCRVGVRVLPAMFRRPAGNDGWEMEYSERLSGTQRGKIDCDWVMIGAE